VFLLRKVRKSRGLEILTILSPTKDRKEKNGCDGDERRIGKTAYVQIGKEGVLMLQLQNPFVRLMSEV